MSKVVGLITARGGSKGIPRKNVKLLAGKPLISWTIEAAQNSKFLDRVVVSTDDEEIALICSRWGAGVPFIRPAELGGDDSPHLPVITHALDWLESNEDIIYDYVVLLQPTSPLRSSYDIDQCIELGLFHNADSVVSVCESSNHPFLSKKISEGKLVDFMDIPDGYLARQNLPTSFDINGAVYFVKRDLLMLSETFYTDNTYAYVMPQKRSLDIDTEWDFYLAGLILNNCIDSL